MKAKTISDYRKRLIKVIDHIYANMGAELDVFELADVALMSPYHFHRIYRQFAQEPVNTTIRRLRLQQAASDLIRTDLSVAKIAAHIGYASIEAFSRAFTKEFTVPPSRYRLERKGLEQPAKFVASLPHQLQKDTNMYSVEIVDLPEINLLGYEHQGDYMNIGQAFEKLNIYSGMHNLLNQDTRSFGIYYHDPGTVPAEELRSAACISSEETVNDGQDEPTKLSLPAGKYATLLFKGSYAEISRPYDWFFGTWLPQSGYEAGEFPPFEEYVNDPRSTPPSELLTRIHCLLVD